jgi:hypothetical protein
MNPWAAFIGGLLLAGIVAGKIGYEVGADDEGYRRSRPEVEKHKKKITERLKRGEKNFDFRKSQS